MKTLDKSAKPEVGNGWMLLPNGEPLKSGDGFLSPHFDGWIDFACRPDLFRNDKEFAHSWPWRRRIEPPPSFRALPQPNAPTASVARLNRLVETFDMATDYAFDDVVNTRAMIELARARGLHVLAGMLREFVV